MFIHGSGMTHCRCGKVADARFGSGVFGRGVQVPFTPTIYLLKLESEEKMQVAVLKEKKV